MAIGSIEIGTIARAQDFSIIKQNEDNKGAMTQLNLSQQKTKDIEQNTKQVREGDNTSWQNKKFDAKDKGNGTYSNNQQKKNDKKKTSDKVIVKGHQSIDIKI